MLGNKGYKHTLRTRKTYCFITATMVTRTSMNVTIYENCLSCLTFHYCFYASVMTNRVENRNMWLLNVSKCNKTCVQRGPEFYCSVLGNDTVFCWVVSDVSGLILPSTSSSSWTARPWVGVDNAPLIIISVIPWTSPLWRLKFSQCRIVCSA
jgi:hypothetical protein